MTIDFQNQFYIVRHGQSENNVLGIESCKLDSQQQYGLTAKGKADISKEAERYTDFDLIYSSPFRRTQETAAEFAKTSGCDVLLDDRLVDVDLGDLDQQSYDISSATIEGKDNDYVYPNGESFTQVLARLVAFITEVNANNRHKKILIVSHGFPCEALIDWVNGKPLKDWATSIENGKVFPLHILPKNMV